MTSAFRITAFILLLTLGGFTMLDDIRALTGGAMHRFKYRRSCLGEFNGFECSDFP
ncbi:hypothetical protein [Leptothermofonsia sp. ETS-13]|uniref:hypothetical protein n=1 Tax=Leptothermofonsia sp. ETS-13 TaxID=3035696 RepID=UPI003B9FDBF8